MECPTVRIKATTGSYPFTTINEADFDPATQELYVEGEPLPDIKSDAEAQAALESAADDIAATTMKMDEVLKPTAKRGSK